MGKWDSNKKQKLEALLNTGFELFQSQGINKTSIADIAEKAGVAKGTFYLYFKDKYDLRNRLIAHKSSQLFEMAYKALEASDIDRNLEDDLIFIVDYILDYLNDNKPLLTFMYKDLSWGVFKKALTETTIDDEDINFNYLYNLMVQNAKAEIHDPEIMLFLIIELVGATAYSSIIYNDPIDLDKLKPHLYNTIRNIIKEYISS
ncbi:MAG: TetR/AcrR family transcriptional regulator [Butyrivibrio sp.]|jgi:AcrR family transcriptional regulator|nr:TetR/AcrR family transcriptional regulator [Butyrivibrio sp.]